MSEAIRAELRETCSKAHLKDLRAGHTITVQLDGHYIKPAGGRGSVKLRLSTHPTALDASAVQLPADTSGGPVLLAAAYCVDKDHEGDGVITVEATGEDCNVAMVGYHFRVRVLPMKPNSA